VSELAFAPSYQVAPDSTVKPEEVIEVLRQCFDPEIPVNIIDLGLVYDIAIKPERVDVKMTPASTSSMSPCGPQSACPRKRAGN
jgi:metal-sulfur cluster biosynthetic enzyme